MILLLTSFRGHLLDQRCCVFAKLFDYSGAGVRCDVRDPLSRLAKLLSMNPRDFASPVAPGQVSAPVWDENKFIAGRLAHDGEGPHGLRAGGARSSPHGAQRRFAPGNYAPGRSRRRLSITKVCCKTSPAGACLRPLPRSWVLGVGERRMTSPRGLRRLAFWLVGG